MDTEVKLYIVLLSCLIISIPILVVIDLHLRDANAEDFAQELIDEYAVTFDSIESMERVFLIREDPISILSTSKVEFLDMLHDDDTVYRSEIRFYILQISKQNLTIAYKYVAGGLVS